MDDLSKSEIKLYIGDKSCVHVRNLHQGANLFHQVCTTLQGGANSQSDANLHLGAFS